MTEIKTPRELADRRDELRTAKTERQNLDIYDRIKRLYAFSVGQLVRVSPESQSVWRGRVCRVKYIINTAADLEIGIAGDTAAFQPDPDAQFSPTWIFGLQWIQPV